MRIAVKHILPNIMPALIVQATISIATAIIAEASLSFLGLGQQPPAPSWGSMLNTAQRFLTNAPWMAVWPGLAIFLAVLSFNILGDGLRDALDPERALGAVSQVRRLLWGRGPAKHESDPDADLCCAAGFRHSRTPPAGASVHAAMYCWVPDC